MEILKRAISHKWDIIVCLIVIVVCFSLVVIISDQNWKILIKFNLPMIIVFSIIGYSSGVLIRRILRRNNAEKKSFKLIFECVGSLSLKVSALLEESVFTVDWDSSIIPPSIGDDFNIEEFIPGLNWDEKQRLYAIYGHAIVIERSFYKKENATYISIVLMDADEISTTTKSYIEVIIKKDDIDTWDLAPGVCDKLRIGDKIAIDRGSIKESDFMLGILSDNTRNSFSQKENRYFGSSDRCFIQIIEKIFHKNYVEFHGKIVPEDGLFYSNLNRNE